MYRRLAGHRADKPWWDEVTDIVVSAFANHEEVAAEEPRRIFELQPIYNRTYAATCKRGHKRPFVAANYERGQNCEQCAQERLESPEYQAWVREYNELPEVKRRRTERRDFLRESGYWRSDEFRAQRAEYMSRPEVREREQAYQRAYNTRPERKAAARAREVGRSSYYAERNALPEVRERKRRWALKTSRRPGSGQAGLF
jgi:hypothetical protein